MLKLINEKKIK